ncbi:helix-turn-helix transcriptional regulator [Leadbettera azotonutricia]|uniref:Transcriptional regulator, LuxR family protein n=1 Tax=Leadbettera azotonutricia (strain ATCC BAA-888 / DSM 13862 / ZAS-9) TaxID=545695 RepID=F5YFI9_LEAAZ|nr:helix-turn-helix transcriptional regulator [Leadbettera azotonutricia]AEF83452.1 transcriptional regulator, LuxR family protein [Leadbettera azotonutricia ZAS-9]
MHQVIKKIPFERRPFLFLLIPAASMLAGSLLILLFVGIFSFRSSDAKRLLKGELFYISQNVSKQFGDTSVQTVSLSESLSRSIENSLRGFNLSIGELSNNPQALEALLSNELNCLLLALERTSCTGVFLVLDVTVNPSLPNARYSRAGLYMRNTEPKSLDTVKLYLRGFPHLAHENDLALQSRWDMEFDVRDRDFFSEPLDQYLDNPHLPLSRLYYWTFQGAIPDLDEDIILCSIPVIGAGGQIFGVCGFEISSMNFRLNNSPDLNIYNRIVCVLSKLANNGIQPGEGLFSGNLNPGSGKASITRGTAGLNFYESSQTPLAGVHEELRLYPTNSPFHDETFVLTLAIPRQELDSLILGRNIRIILAFAVLLAVSIALAVYLSRRYARLMEKAAPPQIREAPLKNQMFEEFIKRCKTLTPTEKIIFDYYVQGLSNQKILAVKHMSLNTLKTHNTHIYGKLGVSSRDELLLYIELIKKSEGLEKIKDNIAQTP